MHRNRLRLHGRRYKFECFFLSKWSFRSYLYFLAGPIPLRVREAELPIVSDTECIRKVNAVTEKIFILPASSFCAGGEEGNDACQVYFGSIMFLGIIIFFISYLNVLQSGGNIRRCYNIIYRLSLVDYNQSPVQITGSRNIKVVFV